MFSDQLFEVKSGVIFGLFSDRLFEVKSVVIFSLFLDQLFEVKSVVIFGLFSDQLFPRVTVFPTLGNHDSDPPDTFYDYANKTSQNGTQVTLLD